MLAPSYCWRFGCKHYTGVKEFDPGVEASQKHTCEAFPEGIPEPINMGTEFHSEPMVGDNDIQFEVDESLSLAELEDRLVGDLT
jgi:hypothetical protein